MTVLGPIVEVATDLLAVDIPDLFHRSAIRTKPVGNDRSRRSVAFHCFAQKPQSR